MCYDGDASDAWVEEERTARKRWRCVECFAPIPVGVNYICIKTLDDGYWSTSQVHRECMKLWRKVRDELCGGRGLIMIGGLVEELSQQYDPMQQEYDPKTRQMIWKKHPSPAPYKRRLEAIRTKYQQMETT